MIEKLRPFKHLCMTVGNLPTSYLDSMSYYETLCWLCKFLKDEVVPVVNNNSKVVEELETYVKTYFDNLDVQEEVNKKLDEMAESGELLEIISEYLNIKSILCYDTINSLKNAENLINGSYVKTMGALSYDDGNGQFYKVRELTSSDIIDNFNIVSLNNYPTLIAEKIIDNTSFINPLDYGAVGDGIADDTNAIQKCLNKGNVILTKGKYKITQALEIPSNRIFDGGQREIHSTSDYAIKILGEDINNAKNLIKLQNLNINPDKSGIKIENSYLITVENIDVKVLHSNGSIGIDILNGFNIDVKNSRVLGNGTSTNMIGINHVTDNNSSINNITNCSYDNNLLQNLYKGYNIDFSVDGAGNTLAFNNNGFSDCNYSFYLRGVIRPINITSSRIEYVKRHGETYEAVGFDIGENVEAHITDVNVYDVTKPIVNANPRTIIDGQLSCTGTAKNPLLGIIETSSDIYLYANTYIQSTTYKINGTISNNSSIIRNSKIVFNKTDISGNSITPDHSRIYKLTGSTLVNCYGLKGTEFYIYTDNSNFICSSYGNGYFATSITLTPKLLYHCIFIDNNSWTIVN